MGASCTGGSYQVVATNERPKACEWTFPANTKLAPLKSDSFQNVTGIGKGKFGIVFLSKHKATSKHVAIKFIPKQMIYDGQSLQRIQQECNALEKISHPFLIYCFGGYEHNNSTIALVFEYAVGGELYHRMKQSFKTEENAAKFYFCEISLAIAHLHDKLKLVYRDVKPENILIAADGHVKLCDLGFAVPMHDKDSDLNDGCGTAMYVAPEIAGTTKWNQSSHGFPVDWWGVGCVLFELLTGNAPFGDSDTCSKFEIFNNINHSSPPYPLTMNSSVKNIIKGLLNKDPKNRFDFKAICASPWVADINWDHFLMKKVAPPWVPTITKSATTENFLKWELDLPVPGSATSEVIGYCEPLRMPVPKAGALQIDEFDISPEANTSIKGGGKGGRVGKGKGGKGSPSPPKNHMTRSTSSRGTSFKGYVGSSKGGRSPKTSEGKDAFNRQSSGKERLKTKSNSAVSI